MGYILSRWPLKFHYPAQKAKSLLPQWQYSAAKSSCRHRFRLHWPLPARLHRHGWRLPHRFEDERRNRRIHGSRRLDGRPGNLRSHPAVAHDLSRSNDGDDGNNGISQSHDGLAQYSHHFTKAGRLHSTTDKRSQQDENPRRIHPYKGIGNAAFPGINQDRRFNRHERTVDEGNELRRQQQEDED